MILGSISTIDNDNGLQLTIDGEDEPTTKKYTYMASYVPTAGDRVLIEEVGGSYVIMGKIISDVESSGVARTAETAATAESATTAETCTGNAASATISDKTKALDDSVPSEQGQLVTYASTEYISSIGRTVVTALNLSSSKNFVYK
jgi:hypothetical protein